MLEQLDSNSKQQGRTIAELKNLLLEEIQLRKQDHLRIAQLENTVKEWKTELEDKLCTAFNGIHEKLDQIQHRLISHQETVLVEMYQRLTQQQNEVCASILTTVEHKFNINTDALKRLNAPDGNAVQAKLAKLDIGLGISNPGTSKFVPIAIKTENTDTPVVVPNRAVGVVQAIANNSTGNSVSLPTRTPCYMNWDAVKHDKLTKLEFVSYRELNAILGKIEGRNIYDLTPVDMADARKSIRALNVLKVDKFKRLPLIGSYVDIHLNSGHNAFLKQIFTVTDRERFFRAVLNYKTTIQDNSPDYDVFENTHELQWEMG